MKVNKTVGLFDCDNKKPNLALMKLAGFHKAQGCEVLLNPAQPCDINYASCVFPQNADFAYHLRDSIGATIGGSGVDMHIKLPDEVEHSCPDYELYPDMDYSLGFTSRGSSRKCKFCIVPEKEGGIVEHSPLSEFVRHKHVILQDNNFLASPLWREKLQEMIDRDLRVDFNQGLDIRLLTPESAELLSEVGLIHMLRFAWDNMCHECDVIKGINLLRKAGFPIDKDHLSFYILCNYNTTFEQDMWRVQTLHNLNIATFVMMYGKPTRRQKDFQRWANKVPVWKSFTWDKWLIVRKQQEGQFNKQLQPTVADWLEAGA